MSYRLFLFDLDGTLVDTSPGILEALRRMEREVVLRQGACGTRHHSQAIG